MRRRWLVVFAAIFLAGGARAQSLILLADGDVDGWQYQSFNPKKIARQTAYRAVFDEELNRTVLEAESDGGASGYIREAEIDLAQTPYLHLRWRVMEAADNPAEREKAGDDFALRVYLVSGSRLSSRTLSLVRASRAAPGDSWPSPYGNLLHKVRVVAFADALGEWQTTTIDAAGEWRRVFGGDAPAIGTIGLMTDADNTVTKSRARYADIVISASPTPPF